MVPKKSGNDVFSVVSTIQITMHVCDYSPTRRFVVIFAVREVQRVPVSCHSRGFDVKNQVVADGLFGIEPIRN